MGLILHSVQDWLKGTGAAKVPFIHFPPSFTCLAAWTLVTAGGVRGGIYAEDGKEEGDSE